MTTPAADVDVPRAGMLATVRNRRGVVAAVEPFDGETGRLHLSSPARSSPSSPHLASKKCASAVPTSSSATPLNLGVLFPEQPQRDAVVLEFAVNVRAVASDRRAGAGGWSATVGGAFTRVRVHHGPDVVAEHLEHTGRHARVTERAHLVGVVCGPCPAAVGAVRSKPALPRPLDEYAAVAGGSF